MDKFLIPSLLIFFLAIFIAILLLAIFERKGMSLLTSKNLTKLMIIFAFIGPAILAINLGVFSLFPLRLLLIVLYLLISIQILKYQSFSFKGIYVSNYLIFLLIWFLYSSLSLLWASSKSDGIRSEFILLSGLSIVFFSVYYIKSIKDIKSVFYIWIWILPFMLALGTWNYLTGNHLQISGLYNAEERHRYVPTGVFVNPNNFATYLSLTIPFLLSFLKYSKNKLGKIIVGALLIQSVFLLVMSDSRANYIALIIGLAFWFIILNNFSKQLKILTVPILLCSSLYLFVGEEFLLSIDKIGEGIDFNELTSEAGLSGSSVEIRSNLIKNAMFFLTETYGLGVGSGNIEHHMAFNYKYYTYGVLNVHNWWVELIVNYGVVIFILYIIFLLDIFKSLQKIKMNVRTTINEKMICEALFTALIVFLVASISASSLLDFGPQWILLGLVLSFINHMRNSKRSIEI